MSLMTLILGNSVPLISAQDLDEELKNGNHPFLLDVRQPQEYRLGHIPGAKLIPLGELKIRLKELPRDREIVCICATGHRSVPAVNTLTAAGMEGRSLRTGMIAWQMAKRPVKKGMSE
jgi:rhodanese-related sulfurtransferase